MTQIRQPENWKNRAAVLALAFVLFGGMVVACLVMAANALQRDDDVYAVISGGLAVTIASVLVSTALGAFGSSTLRGVSSEAGTTLRPSPTTRWCMAVAAMSLTLTAVLYLMAARWRNDLPFMNPGSPGDATTMMWILLIITVIGSGWYLVKGKTPVVRLGPDGVTYVEGSRVHNESWDDIVDITDISPNRHSRQPICLTREDDRPVVIENAGLYAPVGAALYWMMRHYWRHPENRVELTDGRALERLGIADFVPE
ncbi:hypothetical protein [Mycolicibacterium neworleansense]|uniref:Transmembrane protein n=1 Tax=Mycolicibacterium neworleansense TaxID=146018 RepID=A0A0H5RR44_9MYCO|nr:hypothetical protein [Mycolicibacterium neworleansense]MCV7365718.1 hypothetical protein [Mycolicibacterium neworleansense]CRZ16418.1 hypothetical protein BN2156_03285 [Mycolicibacterium neworleansense]